jgi:hypothetical protein
MKRFISILFGVLVIAFSATAQSHWGVISGANFSTSSAKNTGWRTGGYVGALYDILLGNSWYIQPQLLYSYEENEKKDGSNLYSQHAFTLPVLASFKVRLNDAFSMRINAGPYLQYAMFGRNKEKWGGWWHADFGDHFTYGLKGGIALEHKHCFFSMDGKYSLKKSFLNNEGHGLTLSVGIGYKF